MEEYTVTDADGNVTFTGDLLGHASSKPAWGDDALRWTEISIYKTQGGQYVVHKVGRTTVYHLPDATCAKKATVLETKVVEKSIDDGVLQPCPLCQPDEVETRETAVELDRNSVAVSTSAVGCVESCKTHNRNEGTVFLTRVARTALVAASVSDREIADAFNDRRIA
jgi:hypothetical protein